MKIRTGIIGLLVLVAVFFGVFIAIYGSSELDRMGLLLQTRTDEKKKLFDDVMELKGAIFRTQVYDYTYWDEMVRFVSSKDRKWAAANIDTSLDSYRSNAAWVYDMQGNLVYSMSRPKVSGLEKLPVETTDIARLFPDGRFSHFFAATAEGTVEIWGATIHSTADIKRKAAPAGYFFVAKIWDAEYIADLSRILESVVEPVEPGSTAHKHEVKDPRSEIAFFKELKGWDGRPVARFCVRNNPPAFRLLYNSFRNQFLLIVFFTSSVLGVLLVSLVIWVTRPLKKISDSLTLGDPMPITGMQQRSNEFGHIARLIKRFFEQRTTLENEVAARRKTEQELLRAKQDLEEWSKKLEKKVKERTEDLRHSQEKLFRSEKLALVGQLASSVSHELRTPLTAIKNSIYFLKLLGLEKQGEKVSDHLSLIDKEVDSCNQVIANILGFVRQKDVSKRPSCLEDVAKESLSLIIIPSHVDVVENYGKDMPKVSVDPLQIRQVFDNMIKNAIDAMPTAGILTITIFMEGEKAVIEFKDTGVGIAAENLEKIFDPLFSTTPHGTGLGLSVCQRIVEMHGGVIDVKSEKGKGTVFRVIIPADKEGVS